METIRTVLKALSQDERDRLSAHLNARTDAPARVLRGALAGSTAAEIIRDGGMTRGTFSKSRTLARELLLGFVMENVLSNPYDPILLVRWLFMRGMSAEARHQFTLLERTYVRRRLYSVLDALYHEAVRICYQSGDIPWMTELRAKIIANSRDLLRHNTLDKSLLLEMLRLERHRVPSAAGGYESKLAALHKDAVAFGNPVLVHNALYCRYEYFTRHCFSLPKVRQVIGQMRRNLEGSQAELDDYTRCMVANNIANFLCNYAVDGSPVEYFPLIERHIGLGGNIARVDFYGAFFSYHLGAGDIQQARKMYDRVAALPQEGNRFAAVARAMAVQLAWAGDDLHGVGEGARIFYELPIHRDFPEQEFAVRVVEILVALRKGDQDFAEMKAQALRKFSVRRLPQPQEDFAALVLELTRVVRGTPAKRVPRQDIVLRIVRYFLAETERVRE